MSKSFTLTTSRSEPKNLDSSSAQWRKRLNPKHLAFDDNNSTDHLLAVNTVEIVTMIEAETAKIDLEENINETTDRRVIDREAIAHMGIDHHFAAMTAATDRPIVVTAREISPAEIVPPIAETMTDPKAIVLPTEETTTVRKVTARRTKVVAEATDLLTEAETDPKVTDPHIEVAAETDHRTEVVVEIAQVAVVDSDPAVAVDVPAAVADLGQAAAVEDHHSADQAEIAHLEETSPSEEIKIKPLKKARTTKPKQQV